MKRKVLLPQALKRLDPPMPQAFEAKMLGMITDLTRHKEDVVVKKKISLGLVLAAALLLTLMGAALALTSLGVWDFMKDYGETPLPAAVGMVQTEFEGETLALGEAAATIKEAVSDGIVGSIVVEYRTPEGTYLYAPDSMKKGEKNFYGELYTQGAVFQLFGPYYHAMDEHIGVMVDGQEQPLSSEYSFEQVKMADNVLIVNISFSLQGIDPNNLVYRPGIFKMENIDFEQRQRLVAEKPLKLELNLDKAATITPALTDAAAKANIKAVTVTSTPLTFAVQVEFEKMEQDGYTYTFTAQGEPDVELNTSFLSSFAWVYDPERNIAAKGYAPMEALPDTLYIQVERMNASGEQEKEGEPLALSLK